MGRMEFGFDGWGKGGLGLKGPDSGLCFLPPVWLSALRGQFKPYGSILMRSQLARVAGLSPTPQKSLLPLKPP